MVEGLLPLVPACMPPARGALLHPR
jgi:hypothetical protein